ncbi:MAG: ribosome rescue protein RqcH [Methanobacteriota archaeon]
MKLSMSSFDIMVCVRELKNAIGMRVENVYEVDGKVILRLRSRTEGRQDLVIQPGRRVNFTGRTYKAPKQPSSFAMLLRKHLENAEILGVSQPGFERIVEIKLSGAEERILAAEIFGEGNIVLCDQRKAIIQPYKFAVWKHRALKAGEPYIYPPGRGTDIRELDADGFKRTLEGAHDIVRGLAVNVGLGGLLAEEICARASVEKGLKPSEMSENDLDSVFRSIKDLVSQEPAPCVVYESGRPVDVVPLDFKTHLGKDVKRFDSFNEALDEYFSTIAVIAVGEKHRKKFEERMDKLRKRQSDQQEQFGSLYKKSSEAKRKADLVAIHHLQIDEIRNVLEGLKRSKGWRGIVESFEKAKELRESWAVSIKSVDIQEGRVEIELLGQSIDLDMRVSAFENASRFYNNYKSMSEKATGARKALEQTGRELEILKADVPEDELSPPPKRRKPKWFERHRWFVSSEGMLVIGGRDANGNADIVEKHMEPNDCYLHAEIVGAPHVVVKSAGKEVPQTTLVEAAEFAAINSRAWREGLGSLDVYWAMPEQVSKQAPSGTYLAKGSYVIKGKRNLLKVPVRAAVGVMVIDGEKVVVCGPKVAVQKHSKAVVQIYPGQNKKSDLAHKIHAKFRTEGIEAPVDEIERALPPGTGEIR